MLVTVITACGSSSSSSSTATTAPGGQGTSAPSSGAAGASAATLQAQLQQDEAIPTTLPVSTPLNQRPPSGKTVVYLQCAESQCGFEGQGLQAAAQALGWTYKQLNFDETNPATLVSAFNQALQYKPAAVMFPGVPEAVWSSVLPAYRAAGVKIIPAAPGEATIDDVVPGITQGNGWQQKIATAAATFIAVNSNQSAKVLTLSVPSYPVFVPNTTQFEATLKQDCPNCTNTVVNATIPDLLGGKIPGLIVSQLKRSPDVTYIYAVDGAFITGLTAALQAAGLSGKYKIVSTNGTATNMQNIKSGIETATTGSGFISDGWLAMDMALRATQGLPVGSEEMVNEAAPLLTQANVPAPTNSYDVPSDYASQFEKLWLVS